MHYATSRFLINEPSPLLSYPTRSGRTTSAFPQLIDLTESILKFYIYIFFAYVHLLYKILPAPHLMGTFIPKVPKIDVLIGRLSLLMDPNLGDLSMTRMKLGSRYSSEEGEPEHISQ
jgi:hypothetical protein